MHAYRAFIEQQMDQRGWTAADLARQSGLSPQALSKVLNDDREELDRRPADRTIDGLAKAFGTDRIVILSAVARAMNLPIDEPVTRGLDAYSTIDLIEELLERARQEAYADSTENGGAPVYTGSRFVPSDRKKWLTGDSLLQPLDASEANADSKRNIAYRATIDWIDLSGFNLELQRKQTVAIAAAEAAINSLGAAAIPAAITDLAIDNARHFMEKTDFSEEYALAARAGDPEHAPDTFDAEGVDEPGPEYGA